MVHANSPNSNGNGNGSSGPAPAGGGTDPATGHPWRATDPGRPRPADAQRLRALGRFARLVRKVERRPHRQPRATVRDYERRARHRDPAVRERAGYLLRSSLDARHRDLLGRAIGMWLDRADVWAAVRHLDHFRGEGGEARFAALWDAEWARQQEMDAQAADDWRDCRAAAPRYGALLNKKVSLLLQAADEAERLCVVRGEAEARAVEQTPAAVDVRAMLDSLGAPPTDAEVARRERERAQADEGRRAAALARAESSAEWQHINRLPRHRKCGMRAPIPPDLRTGAPGKIVRTRCRRWSGCLHCRAINLRNARERCAKVLATRERLWLWRGPVDDAGRTVDRIRKAIGRAGDALDGRARPRRPKDGAEPGQPRKPRCGPRRPRNPARHGQYLRIVQGGGECCLIADVAFGGAHQDMATGEAIQALPGILDRIPLELPKDRESGRPCEPITASWDWQEEEDREVQEVQAQEGGGQEVEQAEQFRGLIPEKDKDRLMYFLGIFGATFTNIEADGPGDGARRRPVKVRVVRDRNGKVIQTVRRGGGDGEVELLWDLPERFKTIRCYNNLRAWQVVNTGLDPSDWILPRKAGRLHDLRVHPSDVLPASLLPPDLRCPDRSYADPEVERYTTDPDTDPCGGGGGGRAGEFLLALLDGPAGH